MAAQRALATVLVLALGSACSEHEQLLRDYLHDRNAMWIEYCECYGPEDVDACLDAKPYLPGDRSSLADDAECLAKFSDDKAHHEMIEVAVPCARDRDAQFREKVAACENPTSQPAYEWGAAFSDSIGSCIREHFPESIDEQGATPWAWHVECCRDSRCDSG